MIQNISQFPCILQYESIHIYFAENTQIAFGKVSFEAQNFLAFICAFLIMIYVPKPEMK